MGRHKDIDAYLACRVDRHAEYECWEWNGSKDMKGYGRVRMKGEFRGKKAHRVVYMRANPHIDLTGYVVRHLCHNPSCCNPKHLLHGTPKENATDSVLARRIPHGEAIGAGKLTERKVRAIRTCLLKGVPVQDIATLCEVTHTAIVAIRDEKSWRHLVD